MINKIVIFKYKDTNSYMMSKKNKASRRKVLQAIGTATIGTVAASGTVSADQSSNEENWEKDKDTKKKGKDKEVGYFDEDDEVLSEDELPISSDEFENSANTDAIVARDDDRCLNISIDGLSLPIEGSVCKLSDGGVDITISGIGFEETTTIEQGETEVEGRIAFASGYLPGTTNEIRYTYESDWSGSSLESLDGELEVWGWTFSDGWGKIGSTEFEIID